jgi:acyl carrier protein
MHPAAQAPGDSFASTHMNNAPADALPEKPAEKLAERQRLLAIVQEFVREMHPDQLDHPGHSRTVTLHASFERDLALDSLARVELVLRVGRAFNVELPAQALSEVDSAGDLLRLLGHAPRKSAPGAAISLPRSGEIGGEASVEASGETDLPRDAQTLLEVLEWHVARHGERIHVVLCEPRHGEQPISYRDLFNDARAIAAGLASRSVQPGQTVALMLPTGRDYLASFFGIMMAGAIPVPIYPPARAAQIEEHIRRHRHILSNAGAILLITVPQARQVALMLQTAVPSLTAILTPQELAAPIAPRPFKPRAGDIAFLQYTSGSTGDPKGVALTHANLLANIRALSQASQATADDVFVSWLPLYHDMGLIGAWLGSLYQGMPLILMSPLAFLARPALWLQTIARYRGTMSAAPNFAYELCVRHVDDAALKGVNLDTWRLAFNGAEPVSPLTIEAFARRFAPYGLRREAITPVYGLAESSVGLAFPPLMRGPLIDVIDADALACDGAAVPAAGAGKATLSIPCCGKPLPGHEIRIVDESEHELPERRVGRLEFRGPSATAGYYRNPAATRALFRQGWLDSGDYAYLAAGEVYVTGRVKDLIKRGGRNLYPYDVEQAVGNLAGIRKGCVAAFASRAAAGATERLIIVAETRITDEAARSALVHSIQQAAIDIVGGPADDVVLAPPHAVLKTSSGKLRRLACREAYEKGSLGAGSASPSLQRARLLTKAALAHISIRARQLKALAYASYAWLLLAVIALFCGAGIAVLQRPRAGRRIASFGARTLFRLAGMSLSAKGLNRLPDRPHLLIVNHASYLDVFALTALLPANPGYAFVAKQELAQWPAIGAMIRGLGTVPIGRYDPAHSAEGVARMVSALLRGENLIVFPEGSFWRQAGLQAFQTGAFAAAAKANVPVVVAGLRGTRGALRSGTWLPARCRLELETGPTIIPTGPDWDAAVQLHAAAREAMLPLSGEFDAAD